MAVKDQCEQCTKHNKSCSGNMEYNGQSCDQYTKRINLEKDRKQIVQDRSEGNQQLQESVCRTDNPSSEDIHGWLVLLLFSIGAGGLVSALYPIFTYDIEEYGGSVVLALSDIVIGVALFALAVYTIYAFLKRKPNAVYLAKVYCVTVLIFNVVALLGGEFEESGINSISRLVRSLIWNIIWLVYLTKSEQVNDIIPRISRKIFNRDYYFTAAFVIVPLLMYGIGIADIQSQRDKKEAEFISSTDLAYNEYSDGRIVFAKPDGFTCERCEIEDPELVFFEMESGDGCAMFRICSDYDTDVSVKNFHSYWEAWKDPKSDAYRSKELLNEKREINGNPYYIKIVRYETEIPVVWHYVLLFDTQSGKICSISYYQTGDRDYYLDSLLKSIRF